VFIQIFAGWRERIISKSCSRLRVILTGRRALRASRTVTGWIVDSILPPKAPPTRGVTARTLDIGRPRLSATLAWTRNTDWLPDHTVTLPAASTSATAEHGS